MELLEALPERVSAAALEIMHQRDVTRDGFSAVRQEMAAMGASLRTEIRAGDEETRRYMRVLHEELISRIASIQEGRRPRSKS